MGWLLLAATAWATTPVVMWDGPDDKLDLAGAWQLKMDVGATVKQVDVLLIPGPPPGVFHPSPVDCREVAEVFKADAMRETVREARPGPGAVEIERGLRDALGGAQDEAWHLRWTRPKDDKSTSTTLQVAQDTLPGRTKLCMVRMDWTLGAETPLLTVQDRATVVQQLVGNDPRGAAALVEAQALERLTDWGATLAPEARQQLLDHTSTETVNALSHLAEYPLITDMLSQWPAWFQAPSGAEPTLIPVDPSDPFWTTSEHAAFWALVLDVLRNEQVLLDATFHDPTSTGLVLPTSPGTAVTGIQVHRSEGAIDGFWIQGLRGKTRTLTPLTVDLAKVPVRGTALTLHDVFEMRRGQIVVGGVSTVPTEQTLEAFSFDAKTGPSPDTATRARWETALLRWRAGIEVHPALRAWMRGHLVPCSDATSTNRALQDCADPITWLATRIQEYNDAAEQFAKTHPGSKGGAWQPKVHVSSLSGKGATPDVAIKQHVTLTTGVGWVVPIYLDTANSPTRDQGFALWMAGARLYPRPRPTTRPAVYNDKVFPQSRLAVEVMSQVVKLNDNGEVSLASAFGPDDRYSGWLMGGGLALHVLPNASLSVGALTMKRALTDIPQEDPTRILTGYASVTVDWALFKSTYDSVTTLGI